MSPKEIKKYKENGVPQSVIDFTIKFLQDNNYKLFNLAMLDNKEFRIMFTNHSGWTDARIFKISE